MSNENKQLVRRWVEGVWNQQKSESVEAMYAADGLAYGLGADGGPLRGAAGFEEFHQAFLNAFPNLNVSVEDVIAEGDKVAIRWRATDTLRGDGLGVKATGNSMAVTGMSFVRVVNGKIAEGWNNFDVLGMHQQVGTL